MPRPSDAPLRVFLSYTASDLVEHARAAARAVRRMEWVAVDHRDWTATGQPSLEWCREKVRGCDAVVVLVGYWYGWVPTVEEGGDGERSVVWLEVEEARANGIPVLVLVVDPEGAWPVKHIEALSDPVAGERLTRFKGVLSRSACASFTTPESLEAVVHRVLAAFDRLDVLPSHPELHHHRRFVVRQQQMARPVPPPPARPPQAEGIPGTPVASGPAGDPAASPSPSPRATAPLPSPSVSRPPTLQEQVADIEAGIRSADRDEATRAAARLRSLTAELPSEADKDLARLLCRLVGQATGTVPTRVERDAPVAGPHPPGVQAALAIREALARMDAGDLDGATALLDSGTQEPALVPFVAHARARLAMLRGDLDLAAADFEVARRAWVEQGHRTQEAMAAAGIGVVAWQSGDRLAAESWFRQAVVLAGPRGMDNWASVLLQQFLEPGPDSEAAPLDADMLHAALGQRLLAPDGLRDWLRRFAMPAGREALATSLIELAGPGPARDVISMLDDLASTEP